MYKLKSKNKIHSVVESTDIDGIKDDIDTLKTDTTDLKEKDTQLSNSIQANTIDITAIKKELSDIKAGSTVVAVENHEETTSE